MNILNHNAPTIIGIDHGYGNIKTANCCFKTGVASYDKEPTFKSNLLVYEGRYYLIGEEHKEFAADKMADSDYFILTLAAVARELNIRRQTSARVHLAAGLPLTWVSEQKDDFRKYLTQRESADFTFRGVDYHVEITGADIFPQGFAAVADRLPSSPVREEQAGAPPCSSRLRKPAAGSFSQFTGDERRGTKDERRKTQDERRRTKDGGIEHWQSIIWRQKSSAGARAAPLWRRPPI